ncbi:MAG: hypothetical protein E7812_13590 [Phenylobacterium sp.]|nr:MAG: hypothetical protein E7812_13590 [Phenylobacterium sp.]
MRPLKLWRWALCGGFALVAAGNLPGQMTYDSVVSLAEGRSGHRLAWGPPTYSWILGLFDKVLPGTGLYLVVSMLLLFTAWASLPRLRPALSWFGPAALLLVLATPQVVLYQGIVWKDVFFANVAVAGFVAIAGAAARWDVPWAKWAPLAFAALCLALGSLVRQNGSITWVFSALALAWTARGGGWKRIVGWGAAGFMGPLLVAIVLSLVNPIRQAPGDSTIDQGLHFLQSYDLLAALAHDPHRPMPTLERINHTALQTMREEARRAYSPTRTDAMDKSPSFEAALGQFDNHAVAAEWEHLIVSDPAAYARQRLEIFDWVFLTPKIDSCVPIEVGIDGPPDIAKQLDIDIGVRPQDAHIYNYATWFLDTPVFSHAFFAALAVLVAGFLLVRRQRADGVIAALIVAALAFAASFYVISLACDYRYLYFLDMAAITGVLYVAIDPSLPRRGSRRG